MSLSDIKIQMQELYGTEISESLINRITDDVLLMKLNYGKGEL